MSGVRTFLVQKPPGSHSDLDFVVGPRGPSHRGARACVYASVSVCERVRDLGFWPCGLWVLAVWRCLIYARKVGVYLRNQGEAQSQTPTFYSRTSGCPRGGGHMVGVLSALGRNTPPTYASIHLPGALPLEPAICLVRIGAAAGRSRVRRAVTGFS